MSKISALDRISFYIFLATVFLMPFFFLPGTGFSLGFAKSILLSAGVILSLIFWLIARLIDGRIVFPKSPLLLAGLGLVLVYALSAFFSPVKAVSFFGFGFEIGTWANIVLLFLTMFLASVFCSEKRNCFLLFSGLALSFIISAASSIALLSAGPESVLAQYLPFSAIGSLNDLAIFAGLILILSVLALQFLSLTKSAKIFIWLLIALSLFIMAVSGYLPPWIVAGIALFILFVYGLSTSRINSERSFPTASFLVVVLFLVFILTFNIFGAKIPGYFNIMNQEVRPSAEATYIVTKAAILEDPALGAGPNRFSNVWQLHKPDGVNLTDYWNTDFKAGFGFIPSQVATTGLAGGLAWLAFIILFAYFLGRRIFGLVRGKDNFVSLAAALIGLYLLIFAIIYVPSVALLVLLFVMAGIFISNGSGLKKKYLYTLNYLKDPRLGFFAILSLVVFIGSVIAFGYVFTKKFVGVAYFSQAVQAKATDEGLALAERQIVKALSFDRNDLYFRSLSQIYLLSLKTAAEPNKQALLSRAEEGAKLAVAWDPTNYLNWLSLGAVYEAVLPFGVSGAYEGAKSSYENALKLNPQSPNLYFLLARLEYLNNNPAGAAEYLKIALKLKPDYEEARRILNELK